MKLKKKTIFSLVIIIILIGTAKYTPPTIILPMACFVFGFLAAKGLKN